MSENNGHNRLISARTRYTALSLAAVLAAFLAYRVVAVPFVEPTATVRVAEGTGGLDDPNTTPHGGPEQRNAALLNAIFPVGAWQRNDPIVLESDQAMLLMRDYQNLPTGEVKLDPCTIVFFPNADRTVDETLLRRVIVLEAPQGAVLQFDEPFDLRKAKIGKLVGGHMSGPITIRGNPGGYEGQDEIFAETSDIQMTQDRVFTPERVTFRIGPNHGRGRELQMKLVMNGPAKKSGPNIGGLESLELIHDVFMHLVPGNTGLFPGDHPSQAVPRGTGNVTVNTPDVGQPGGALPAANGLTPIGGARGLLAGNARTTPVGNPAGLVPIVPRDSLTPTPPGQTPVEITCQGPFKYNLVDSVATFKDQVNIVRPMRNGPADQGTCEQLNVRFQPRQKPELASREPAAGDTKPVAKATSAPEARRGSSSNLEPRSVEMLGNPAILRALSNDAFAQGQRLEYDVPTGRITAEDEREVAIRQGGNEIHAQRVIYQPAEPGRLGRLVAIGPGWLKGAATTTNNQTWEAQWKNELRIRPNEGQQVISLLGGGHLRFGEVGNLLADEIYFWLNEVPLSAMPLAANPLAAPNGAFNMPAADSFGGAANGPLASSGTAANGATGNPTGEPRGPVQIVPNKMLCRGNVTIESTQVNGTTDRLEMWFKPVLPMKASLLNNPENLNNPANIDRPLGFPAAGVALGGSGVSGGEQNKPAPANGAGAAPAPVARFTGAQSLGSQVGAIGTEKGRESISQLPGGAFNPQNSEIDSRPPVNQPAASTQHFDVHGKLIRLQALLTGQRTTVDDVTIEGEARLDETHTQLPGERPLHLDGDQLQILGAAGTKTTAKVKGKPATVDARGLALVGEVIQLDRGANRLWMDGPGKMLLPMDRSFDGRPLAQPIPLEVVWQGRMNFDGVTARFERAIDAHTELQSLKTETLAVSLLRKIDFAQPPQGERPVVNGIDCQGGVLMESRKYDGQRLVDWQRMQTKDLNIEQSSGAILAHGPGWCTRIWYGPAASGNFLGGQPNAAQPAAIAAAPAEELHYLNVQFLKEITGNLTQREMIFHEQVHTVFGPIKDWKDELNADRIESLGPRGVLMTCQAMKIVDMPARPPATGTLEIDARENVMIDAQAFTARAARVSYAQAKDLIILEGDGRSDAQLFRQQVVGGPTGKTAAKKILYWRGSNRVELDDFRFLDLGQISGGGGGGLGSRLPANTAAPVPKPRAP